MNEDQSWEPLRSTTRLATDRTFGYVEAYALPAWANRRAERETDEENQAI
jgi:hypothetical protein